MERANYVERLWKLAQVPMLNPPSPIGSGWDEDGGTQLIENMLPDEVSSIFLKTDDSDSEDDHCDYKDESMARKKLKVKILITMRIRT